MNTKNKIKCKCCGNEIINKDDLIVTNYFFSIATYHYDCYCKEIREQPIVIVGKFIINSVSFNVSTVIACIAGFAMLFSEEVRYYSIIFFLFLFVRAYSWFKYEKYL